MRTIETQILSKINIIEQLLNLRRTNLAKLTAMTARQNYFLGLDAIDPFTRTLRIFKKRFLKVSQTTRQILQ